MNDQRPWRAHWGGVEDGESGTAEDVNDQHQRPTCRGYGPKPPERQTPREKGVNPRSRGTSPRQTGQNPRAKRQR